MSYELIDEKKRKILESVLNLKDALSDLPPSKGLAEKDEVLRLKGQVAALSLYIHVLLMALYLVQMETCLSVPVGMELYAYGKLKQEHSWKFWKDTRLTLSI